MVSIISHVNQQRRQEGSCEPHWLTLTLQQTLIITPSTQMPFCGGHKGVGDTLR